MSPYGIPAFFFEPPPTPVHEMFEDGVDCEGCGEHLTDMAYYDGVGAHYCEDCIVGKIDEAKSEASEFAIENCRITKPLPYSDLGRCRHNCTNYEELIEKLNKDGVIDQVFYSAIRERIDELLDHAIHGPSEENEGQL